MGLNDAQRQALVDAAVVARQHAHAPFSGFDVGAAVLTDDGTLFAGCNVEVSNYSEGCCAERIAAFKAISAGHRHLVACAVVATMAENPCGPCGACRQVLRDFGPEMEVVLGSPEGEVLATMPLQELFPMSFGPEHVLASIRARHGGD
jgi:cytidine deaminase